MPNRVSRRVGKDITRICRGLAHAAAVYLCPAVRKRDGAQALSVPRRRKQIEKEASAKSTDAATMLLERLCLFSRMIGSAPATACHQVTEEGIEVFVHRLSDQEYSLGLSVVQKRSPAPDRRNKRPSKSGLELIRLTLNLARGDLEQGSHFTAAPAG